MNTTNEKKFLNSFLLVPGVGYETASRLKQFFSSYEEAWCGSMRELKALGISEKTAEAIVEARLRIDPEREMERLINENINFINADDTAFPSLLKEIPSPAHWLYIKGGLNLNKVTLAVVGSRKATSYGREAAERIISGLAEVTDIQIASGLAIGIDAEAHISSLKHNLPTIGVIGTGLDPASFFPTKNIRLANEIIEKGGAIVSEYPLGMPALKQNFIQRNRIIAGLAKGTLIVEAAERSGALITAHFALEQGRSVMAIPGSIFSPYSLGCHALLKDGACPIFSAEDVIEELGLEISKIPLASTKLLTNKNEKGILDALDEPLGVEGLKERVKISTADIISSLSMLELKGLVKEMGSGLWVKSV